MTVKKKVSLIILAVLVLAALIVSSQSFFVLEEYESAVRKRFGSIVEVYVREDGDRIRAELEESGKFSDVKVSEGSGLKFIMPFVDEVTKYDSRLMTYETPSRQIITADKKKLLFDNNAQWRISNPLLFNISMGSMSAASTRIDDFLYSRMNEKVGKIQSHDLISNNDDKVTIMLDELATETTEALREFGIEVFDIRIKRTDLPEENYESIYNRMITERNKIAAKYRSEGDEEAIKITSETDRQVTVLLSEAKMKAEILMGEGDSEAARIYNEAYSSDPEFYEFYSLLETYRSTMGDEVSLVIPSDSEFAKYLLGYSVDEEKPEQTVTITE